MKIVIDLQGCQSASRLRGIGRYSLALAKAVIRNRGTHSVKLLLNGLYSEGLADLRQQFLGEIAHDDFLIFDAEGPVAEFDTNNTTRARIAELARERLLITLNPDVVLLTSLFEGFVDDAVTSVGLLGTGPFTAVTLYDLIPYLNPDPEWPSHYKNYYNLKIESLKRADVLLSISDYARLECLEAIPEFAGRVVNMSTACDDIFTAEPIVGDELARLLQKYDIKQPFVMSAGNLEPRKNLRQLVLAFAELPTFLRDARQVVLVGGTDQVGTARILQVAAEAGLRSNQVRVLGHVADEDLRALYSACELFVFPSLHEGFGLPPLEAMSCGAVVIGSSATSVPEVIGRADALFDPTSVPQLRDLITRALTDQNFRQSLQAHSSRQAAEFSWDKTAIRALDAIEARLHKRSARLAPQPVVGGRPRLAMFTPLPPERTGIADYVAELLPTLQRRYDITVISDQSEVWPAYSGEEFTVNSVAWFKQNASLFERIVYQVGNSPFHVHMLDLMREYPGVVVLHDFFLSSLTLWMEDVGYRTDAMKRSLVRSHGYQALEFLSEHGRVQAKFRWPCSYDVISNALGVVVHSNYSRDLARAFYGEAFAAKIRVVRQHRSIVGRGHRVAARRALGYSEDDFVVCAFGFMDRTKLNHLLLEAWSLSALAKDVNCHLVFVGGREELEYGSSIDKMIQEIEGGVRIGITGFVAHDAFVDYLSVSDAAIQLRTDSRGETSRTVLDCLAYGIPLIANANGPMAEYPDDVLIKLADQFEVQDLVNALELLRNDPVVRERLQTKGIPYIEENHAPDVTAAGYAAVIEGVWNSECSWDEKSAAARFWKADPANLLETNDEVARKVTDLIFSPRRPCIYLDISATARNDLKTGIERVARSVVSELLFAPPAGYDVIPVYLDEERGRWFVRKAQRYLSMQKGFELVEPRDERVIPLPGDILFGLDLFSPVEEAAQQGLYTYWRASGAGIGFMVFDILPITRPEFFPPWAYDSHRGWTKAVTSSADVVVCISEHVRGELALWLESNGTSGDGPALLASHLGADVAASFPSKGLPADADRVIQAILSRPTFLMVGTIEPRKGHLQAIEAFERLWRQGVDVNLVIVGHEGWKPLPAGERRTIPATTDKIRNSDELGRRLYWLEGISDEYLSLLYKGSACLLAPSEGEGYGLPLIEAAQYRIPIVARDIPVFREVAADSAHYFVGTQPEHLERAVLSWLDLRERGQVPDSGVLQWDTWEQSARRLGRLIVNSLGKRTH